MAYRKDLRNSLLPRVYSSFRAVLMSSPLGLTFVGKRLYRIESLLTEVLIHISRWYGSDVSEGFEKNHGVFGAPPGSEPSLGLAHLDRSTQMLPSLHSTEHRRHVVCVQREFDTACGRLYRSMSYQQKERGSPITTPRKEAVLTM